MIRLNLSREPFWLALPGLQLRLRVRPASTALIAWARQAAAREVEGAESADANERFGLAQAAFVRALARAAILDWEGVFAGTSEEKAPLSPENVGALADLYPIGDLFFAAYLNATELVAAEKKRLRARGLWHFGGGRGYCLGCERQGLGCAGGGRIGGRQCPYDEHAPLSAEGHEAWDVAMRLATQIRVSDAIGVIGFDYAAALAMADALGYGRAALIELLPAVEAGMLEALKDG